MRLKSWALLSLVAILGATAACGVEVEKTGNDQTQAASPGVTEMPPTTDATATVGSGDASPTEVTAEAIEERPEDPPPFDFSPYRVMIWVVSDDPRIDAAVLRKDLLDYLDRDFFSIWRTVVADAPTGVATMAKRDLSSVDFQVIAASDPVIAVKRDHPDSLRIHFASDAGRYLKAIRGTPGRIEDILQRIAADPDAEAMPAKFTWKDKLQAINGDAVQLRQLWHQPETEALLVSRGMAETLDDPEAKLIIPPVKGQVVQAIENFDKIYIANIQTRSAPTTVSVVELDTLMHYFGQPVSYPILSQSHLTETLGWAIREAFSPVARIDDAGQKSATGLIRASGLALDENSPAHINVGDILIPLVRKEDRKGKPLTIGPLDWAYLYATKKEGRKIEMDLHSGRMGGLQGRKNNRMHRMAIRTRPTGDSTLLRLHAKGNTNQPLIGYEIYDKELDSTSMTFVGRTDWNGRLPVGKIETPLRLLYVKNGGAVLARLPIVPGYDEGVVADLEGDDMRLQAESYIRGVQNAIIDLVAVRELFKARIMMRLRKGELKEAEELLESLRNEPSNEKIANDMGKKQTEFLKAIGRNANQQRKVDEMFSTTRSLLSKHINPKLVNDLEEASIQAKKTGKLPAEPE